MLNRRLTALWTPRQGLFILLGFILLYSTLSMTHMLVVKHSIGFAAHIGSAQQPNPIFLLLSQAIKASALLLVVHYLALRRHHLSWQAIGLVCSTRRWLMIAVVIAVAGFALRLLLAKYWVTVLPQWARFSAPNYVWQQDAIVLNLILIFTTVIITPFAEEVFYRGFLFRWMASRYRIWLAALISSLMFGASHIVPPQIISAALMSLLITWLYWRSESLWPSILCHGLNNAFGVLLSMMVNAKLLPTLLQPMS